MKTVAKWTLVISLSLAAHAGAAILFLPDAPPPPFAAEKGGEAVEVALLGNAFEEATEAGAHTPEVSPVETPVETAVSTPVETASAVLPEPVPAEAEPATPPDVISPTPPETVTSEADVILPLEAPVAADAPEVVAALPPVATVVPEARPREPVREVVPERRAEPEKPKTVQKRTPVRPRKTPEPVASGQAGQAREQATKGRADGSTAGSAARAGQGAKARAAGNADFSNYEGKVRSRLLRSLRYPSRAQSQGAKGVAQVQFTVGANGSVSGIRIAKSAGSPVLDEAALEAARRAAPFPKIPEAAGKSSWLFTVPMVFQR